MTEYCPICLNAIDVMTENWQDGWRTCEVCEARWNVNSVKHKPRTCTITDAGIEDEQGRGDGAYDLLDKTGQPAIVADAIRESLEQGGLTNAAFPLYLNIRIKIEA